MPGLRLSYRRLGKGKEGEGGGEIALLKSELTRSFAHLKGKKKGKRFERQFLAPRRKKAGKKKRKEGSMAYLFFLFKFRTEANGREKKRRGSRPAIGEGRKRVGRRFVFSSE